MIESTTTKPIKVVIVDDHELVRGGLESILGLFDDIELVGQADSGAAAVSLCGETQPDVVLMDLVLPGGMDGAEATKQTPLRLPRDQGPGAHQLLGPRAHPARAAAGALGCLLKNVSGKELAAAIRKAHVGTSTLAPEAADALVHAISSPAGRARRPHAPRAGRPRTHRGGPHQRGDRRAARREPLHRQDPREQHHRQARGVDAHGGGGDRRARAPRLTGADATRPPFGVPAAGHGAGDSPAPTVPPALWRSPTSVR